MISVIIEAIWLGIKKLFEFLGFALILLIVLVICIFSVREYATEKASKHVYYELSDDITFLSLEEQEEKKTERVFRLKVKNNQSEPMHMSMFVVKNEDGEDIFAYFDDEFSDLKIRSALVSPVIAPPGSETAVIMNIDKDKLEGVKKIYISDLSYDDDKGLGTEFEIS